MCKCRKNKVKQEPKLYVVPENIDLREVEKTVDTMVHTVNSQRYN